MNITKQITLIQLALLILSVSFLFTSFILALALLWVDALTAGIVGALSLGLFCLLTKFQR